MYDRDDLMRYAENVVQWRRIVQRFNLLVEVEFETKKEWRCFDAFRLAAESSELGHTITRAMDRLKNY